MEEKFGRIADLSDSRKRDLAAQLSAIGLKKSETNLGSAYGFFLAAAHVAASALPGENAAFALSMTTTYLNKLKALAAEGKITLAACAEPAQPTPQSRKSGLLMDRGAVSRTAPRLPRCASKLLARVFSDVSPGRSSGPRTLDASDDTSPR